MKTAIMFVAMCFSALTASAQSVSVSCTADTPSIKQAVATKYADIEASLSHLNDELATAKEQLEKATKHDAQAQAVSKSHVANQSNTAALENENTRLLTKAAVEKDNKAELAKTAEATKAKLAAATKEVQELTAYIANQTAVVAALENEDTRLLIVACKAGK